MARNLGYAADELLLVDEQLSALERSAERLRAMYDDAPSAEIEIRLNEIIARVTPLERRRQEILAVFATSASVSTATLESQPPLMEIQAKVEVIRKRHKSRQQVAADLIRDIQPELDFLADIEAERVAERFKGKGQAEGKPDGEKVGLIRLRHPNRDFFLADLFDYAIKDDGVSMEVPIYTLSTKPDLSIWEWSSKDSSKSVKVTPSVLGRATMHDKDILIYCCSQVVEGLNRGREDAHNRTVRFIVHDMLVTTNRGVGGDDYKRLHESFERLRGTTITTDIRTGGERVRHGFGIIDEWRIIEKSRTDERMVAVEVTLSRWLFNAIQAFEVLTIHSDYFRLRKPIARRLYELARKHCGHQAQWQIGLRLLHEKSGSRGSIYEFHKALKIIAADNSLPEYRMSLFQSGKVGDVKVTFYTRDMKRLARFSLAKLGK